MAPTQQVKAFVTKVGHLGSIPGAHVAGENKNPVNCPQQ